VYPCLTLYCIPTRNRKILAEQDSYLDESALELNRRCRKGIQYRVKQGYTHQDDGRPDTTLLKVCYGLWNQSYVDFDPLVIQGDPEEDIPPKNMPYKRVRRLKL